MAKESQGLTKGEKKRLRALALKMVHQLDGQSNVRRDDLVAALRADGSAYVDKEIESIIKQAHRNGIMFVERGRYSSVSIA